MHIQWTEYTLLMAYGKLKLVFTVTEVSSEIVLKLKFIYCSVIHYKVWQ